MSEHHCQKSSVQNNENIQTTKDVDMSRAGSSTNEEDIDSMQTASVKSPLKISEIAAEPNKQDEGRSTHLTPDSRESKNDDTKKRKKLFNDIQPAKKIRFAIGYETEYLSREDFSSEENWQKFMRCLAYERTKLAAAHNRNSRKLQKINTLKGMINVLEEKKIISMLQNI